MATSGSEQQLRFRWNDHMQHISKVLTLQRLEEQFCDVTLVSDDGFVMKAHQAILASTSAYFQRVFSDITADQHPMVVLRGANFREMSCLLDYMYQGSTQVHQSLMEAVLEVADMLEVKGLSQIRSNNSIKKFMAPPSSANTTTTTTTHVHSGDNNTRGCSRSPDEQRSSHSPDDQIYRDSQPRTTMTELEGTWIRFSGNTSSETRSVEPVRTPVEGPLTPTEEPPPSSHARVLACQDSNNQEIQDESQMSGIDLSMAKNEPWSPKESSLNEDKNSPSRKRRKLLEGLCSEETLEPVSDPDWGRIGSKIDERPVCQPRTISFTSITSSESGSRSEDMSYNNERVEVPQAVDHQPATLAYGISSTDDYSMPVLSSLECPTQIVSSDLKFMHREITVQSDVLSSPSPKCPIACPCKGHHKNSLSKDKPFIRTRQHPFRNENSMLGEISQPEPIMCNQSAVLSYPPNQLLFGYYDINQSTNMFMHSTNRIANQIVSKPSPLGTDALDGTPLILSVPDSYYVPIISQKPADGKDRDNLGKREEDVQESCEGTMEDKETINSRPGVESLDNSQALHHGKTSDLAIYKEDSFNNANLDESVNCTSYPIQKETDGSHVILTKRGRLSNSTYRRRMNQDDDTPGIAMFSPVPVTYCSSASSTPSSILGIQNSVDIKCGSAPLKNDTKNRSLDEDPIEVNDFESSASENDPLAEEDSSSCGEEKLSTYVNVKHKERILTREVEPVKKAHCPLEERLKRPTYRVKRPLNPYMLFQNKMKEKVMAEHPNESYQSTLKRLGLLWKQQTDSERAKWQNMAANLREEHKRQNPDYHYNPYEAAKRRQQYLKARLERKHLYRITSEKSVGDEHDSSLVSPNLYKPLPRNVI